MAQAAPTLAAQQARSTGVVSLAILCSRLLGLARDQCLNAWFGASMAGIFTAAFRTPNMLRDLFAEGALSTAFVTTFSRKMAQEGDEAAWQLGRKMLSLGLCFMTLLSCAGIAVAPWLVRLLNPGWQNPHSLELCTQLAQVMYPFIAIISVTALVMGMLNAKRVFFVPAVASAFFNLGCLSTGALLAWWMDPQWSSGKLGEKGLMAFAIGTLIGGAMQLLVQWPSLRRVGFRLHVDFGWRDSGVREVLHLMWPSLIAASGTQVSVLLNSIFASYTPGQEAASAWLANAQRLQQLPLGLFGVAVSTVTLPLLSRLATQERLDPFRNALARGLRLVLFLTLPCALGLSLLATEIVDLLFGHGRYTDADVQATAAALQAYAFGLVFYAAIKVVQPAFYTLNKRFVPMLVSLGIVALNAVCNSVSVFVLHWDHRALAWCTAIGLALNFSVLYFMMRRRIEGLEGRLLANSLLRLLPALLVLAAGALAARHWLLKPWAQWSVATQALMLPLVIGGIAALFALSCHWLGVPEARDMLEALRRKQGRSPKTTTPES